MTNYTTIQKTEAEVHKVALLALGELHHQQTEKYLEQINKFANLRVFKPKPCIWNLWNFFHKDLEYTNDPEVILKYMKQNIHPYLWSNQSDFFKTEIKRIEDIVIGTKADSFQIVNLSLEDSVLLKTYGGEAL